MSDSLTGTITFVFTDIEGSTNLVQRLGDMYSDVLATHFEILRAAFSEHGGVEQGTEGDSLFTVFPGAIDAVSAAIVAQRALGEHTWPTDNPVRVRMGIHSGEASYGHDGYVGIDVHRAARISSVAHGGQIVVSASTNALALQAMPADVSFRDLGAHRLKDLNEAERLSQVIAPGLRIEFPPLRSLDVVPHNLPIQLTSFIGRSDEMASIARLLRDSRLVTLNGVGGTGKTRLALQSAAQAIHNFVDGVWLVDLAPVADDEMVDNALASAIGVRDQPGRSLLDTITDVLRDKTTLIVLDNCEHLLNVSAEVVTSVLRSCPAVKVLATSREALGVAGEVTFAVPSLRIPPESETSTGDLTRYDSIALFQDRATLAKTGFKITDSNADAVAQICRRLDAVPLAIELAAARIRVLSPHEIADRLDDMFRLLTGGDRTAVPRQQTLEATVAWSYEQLSDGERLLFNRLAVASGSFTLAAAEAVAGTDGIDERDVLDLLTGLIEKSMLIVNADDVDTRYRLLETLRQYARSRLNESGTAEQYRYRHARFFADFAKRGDEQLRGPSQRDWFSIMEREHDNLTASLTWTLSSGESELFLTTASSLGYLWGELGHWEEARHWLFADPVHDDTQRADLRAKALSSAVLMTVPEDPDLAMEIATQALDLSREAGNKLLVASALYGMGYSRVHAYQQEEAVPLLDEALAVSRSIGDQWGEAIALSALANLLSFSDSEKAATLIEQSRRIFSDLGDELYTAESLYLRAAIENRRNRPDRAIESVEQALAIYSKLDANVGLGHGLRVLGQAKATLDLPAESRDAFEKALVLFSKTGDRHCSAVAQRDLGLIDLSVGDISRAEEHLKAALVLSIEVNDSLNTVLVLEAIGQLAAARRDAAKGATLFGAASQLRAAVRVPPGPDEELRRDRGLDALHGELDDVSFSAAWRRGAAMSRDDAIGYALE